MKATTILNLIERAREPLLKEAHIKAYAEAMIEKDRERLKSLNIIIIEPPIILD